MTRAEAREYSESLGQIHGGGWRQIAWAKHMGVAEALGLTFEGWVQEFIGGHVRLSIGDRREAVKELTADGLSQREVGEVLGVHHRTVERDQAAANAAEASDFSEENGEPEETAAANAAPPPIPAGSRTPHEEAANNPGARWHRSIHDLYVQLNSVRDLGAVACTLARAIRDRLTAHCPRPTRPAALDLRDTSWRLPQLPPRRPRARRSTPAVWPGDTPLATAKSLPEQRPAFRHWPMRAHLTTKAVSRAALATGRANCFHEDPSSEERRAPGSH
jgi:hypothetical protein